MRSPPPEPARSLSALPHPAPPRQRWGWTYRYGVALLGTSVVAVVLAAAGLVWAVMSFGDGEPDAGADCVVGVWRFVEQEQELSSGVLTLIADGPVVEYRADGTAVTDYGGGARYYLEDRLFGGLGNGETVVRGEVRHGYAITDSTMRYVDIDSRATFEVEVLGEVPLELSTDPFGYRCTGDTMTQEIEGRYQATLERTAQ